MYFSVELKEKGSSLRENNICLNKSFLKEYLSIEDNVIERLLDTKLDSVIAGHDHSSNFIVDYKGISLVYATKTGRGCYYNPVVQGGTLIEIKEDSKPAISHILVKD